MSLTELANFVSPVTILAASSCIFFYFIQNHIQNTHPTIRETLAERRRQRKLTIFL
jgi:hypothetical protein